MCDTPQFTDARPALLSCAPLHGRGRCALPRRQKELSEVFLVGQIYMTGNHRRGRRAHMLMDRKRKMCGSAWFVHDARNTHERDKQELGQGRILHDGLRVHREQKGHARVEGVSSRRR